MVQRLEKDFTKLLKTRTDIWFQRWYHIAGKYTEVPADFIVITKNNNILVECKECKTVYNKKNEKRGSFKFERLTQKRPLLNFVDIFPHHKSLILLSFSTGKIKTTTFFVIDIDSMTHFIEKIGKKSANLQDFQENFKELKYCEILANIL